jgi:hypothetical protein
VLAVNHTANRANSSTKKLKKFAGNITSSHNLPETEHSMAISTAQKGQAKRRDFMRNDSDNLRHVQMMFIYVSSV